MSSLKETENRKQKTEKSKRKIQKKKKMIHKSVFVDEVKEKKIKHCFLA